MFIYEFKRDKLLTQYRLWWPLEEFLLRFLVSEMLAEKKNMRWKKKGKPTPIYIVRKELTSFVS